MTARHPPDVLEPAYVGVSKRLVAIGETASSKQAFLKGSQVSIDIFHR